ncbi:MAG: hypothetical protein CO002_03535, partial [Candidatus Portnoybacteria bacterium CG_4_8_14_3_um_filter_44_10]|uniref:Uncharacterized protein n=4 Tax=Candidatus Portnoyibacteriota TaxID=1817913 RepID=A0A2H0WWE1_9BACT
MIRESPRILFNGGRTLFKKYYLDFIFAILLALLLYKNSKNIIFIYKANILTLQLIIPLIIIFIWIGTRSRLEKGQLLTSMSIIFAVFVYLLSFAHSDDSKIKLLSAVDNYNCSVSQDILTSLKGKTDLSQNFTLHYFISQPYFDRL